MELLELNPPDYGVGTGGIYIIDDDGERVFAGPFVSEIAAIAWIDHRQQNLARHKQSYDATIHRRAVCAAATMFRPVPSRMLDSVIACSKTAWQGVALLIAG